MITRLLRLGRVLSRTVIGALFLVFTLIVNAQNGSLNTSLKLDFLKSDEVASVENFETYSSAGTTSILSDIIGIRAIDAAGNSLIDGGGIANTYFDLTGTDQLPIIGDVTGTVDAADFPGAPGSYLTSPDTHQFRVDYRLSPGLDTYTAGYYGINLVYTLAEDL